MQNTLSSMGSRCQATKISGIFFKTMRMMLFYSFSGVARRNISSRDQKGSRDKKKLMHTPKLMRAGLRNYFLCVCGLKYLVVAK